MTQRVLLRTHVKADTSLIHVVEVHIMYKKIALFYIYSVITYITMCTNNRCRDMILKTTLENLYIEFFHCFLRFLS